mmetsp:Transcript_79791/g.223919  ORF Transcript_79791/g.223919 Transcript_79791/m.223919 type:complete len:302 (-) Transcript_79791:232-1137(-)
MVRKSSKSFPSLLCSAPIRTCDSLNASITRACFSADSPKKSSNAAKRCSKTMCSSSGGRGAATSTDWRSLSALNSCCMRFAMSSTSFSKFAKRPSKTELLRLAPLRESACFLWASEKPFSCFACLSLDSANFLSKVDKRSGNDVCKACSCAPVLSKDFNAFRWIAAESPNNRSMYARRSAAAACFSWASCNIWPWLTSTPSCSREASSIPSMRSSSVVAAISKARAWWLCASFKPAKSLEYASVKRRSKDLTRSSNADWAPWEECSLTASSACACRRLRSSPTRCSRALSTMCRNCSVRPS